MYKDIIEPLFGYTFQRYVNVSVVVYDKSVVEQ